MNRRLVINTVLATVAANVIFWAWGRHTFMPLGLVWVSAVLLGILLLVLAAILQAFNKARPDPAAKLTIHMSVASAIVCFAMLPTVPILKKNQKTDLDAARTRAETLAPALLHHLYTTGLYPSNLDAVAGAEALPWLLKEPDAYRSTGTGYVIQVRYPGNPFLADERRDNETTWRTTQ